MLSSGGGAAGKLRQRHGRLARLLNAYRVISLHLDLIAGRQECVKSHDKLGVALEQI